MGSRIGYTDDRATAPEGPPPKGIIRDYVETILVCVIFLIFSRAFVFQQSKIPSGSMENTLLIGDFILVNRYVFSPADSAWEKRWLPVREIRRGDVIVFKFPNEPEIDYIKRVIGLPGDVVEERFGEIYVNGAPLVEPYVPDAYRDKRSFYPPRTIPEGHYFALGDHRNRSSDSRVWGLVPQELIKGRAVAVWYSYEDDANDINLQGTDRLKSFLTKLTHFPWKSRWSRCLTLIR